jgi:Na+/pantothenate symporter
MCLVINSRWETKYFFNAHWVPELEFDYILFQYNDFFYFSQGGMKAVMWTDAFQIIMMFAGLIAILIKGSMDHGGFGNIFNYLSEGQRIEFFK